MNLILMNACRLRQKHIMYIYAEFNEPLVKLSKGNLLKNVYITYTLYILLHYRLPIWFTQTFPPVCTLQQPADLIHMPVDCGSKIHTGMARTCKLHTDLLLQHCSCEATVYSMIMHKCFIFHLRLLLYQPSDVCLVTSSQTEHQGASVVCFSNL